MAAKAGIYPYKDNNFKDYLSSIIQKKNQIIKNICVDASVSERMFFHIRSGKFLPKPSLIAIAIALDLTNEEINVFLNKAGYVLSDSIYYAAVIKYLLLNRKNKNGNKLLLQINDVLYSLDLPLLMTRSIW